VGQSDKQTKLPDWHTTL